MKKGLLSIFVLLFFSITVFAQRQLSGIIRDDHGEPLMAAEVSLKDGSATIQTDESGSFTIEVPDGDVVLIISYAGSSEEKAIKASETSIDFSFASKASDEIGGVEIYGQKINPATKTGSVTTVTAKDIEKRSITNVVKALDGKAGIQVASGGGQPGSSPDLLMRGLGSLSANSSPLIVVDGTPYDGSLNSINPNDVETMTVLKDATASSLYGSKGANGVILITTKTGKKGDKPTINFDFQAGVVSRMMPLYKTVGPQGYVETAWQMYKNYMVDNGATPDAGQFWGEVLGGYKPYDLPIAEVMDYETGKVNPNAKLLWEDNWLKMMERTGARQQYGVSVSNGDDKSDYYFSIGYNNDQGIIQHSSYDRITTRLNVNSKVVNWLKVGFNVALNYDNKNSFADNGGTAYLNPFFGAQNIGSIFPVYLYDTNGVQQFESDGTPKYDFGNNPEYGRFRNFAYNDNTVAQLTLDERNMKTYAVRGIGYFETYFLKDFTLRSDLTLDYLNYNQKLYYNSRYGQFSGFGGAVDQSIGSQIGYTWRQLLIWKPSWGIFESDKLHHLAVTLDHENYLLNSKNYVMSRSGFTSPDFTELSAAAVNGGTGGSVDNLASEAYLALVSYDYDSRYYVKGSFRRDASSRFSPQSRWGNFWSFGAGWTLTKEEFMADLRDKWLDNLQLRVSYGIQGNEDLGTNYYNWLPTYYFNPNASHPGYSFNTWGNPDLRWEGQYMFNVGADFGFFRNSRLSLTLDYYDRGSNDLLYVRPYAPSVGIGGIQANVGNMKNSGIEAVIKANILRADNIDKVGWNVELNLQHNKNKITKMQDIENDSIFNGVTLMTVGEAVGTYFMPQYAGVDSVGKEMWKAEYIVDADANSPTYGEVISNASGVTYDYTTASMTQNLKLFGSGFRDVEGSMVNDLSYKGVELSFQINFGLGGHFYDGAYQTLMGPDNAWQGRAWSEDILKSWTPDNPNPEFPRVDLGAQSRASDRFLVSNSFLKIQSINLGYNLPSKWLKGSTFKNIKIYGVVDNVYLLAARKGLDVQQNFFGSSSYNYFPYRSIMFGVRGTL